MIFVEQVFAKPFLCALPFRLPLTQTRASAQNFPFHTPSSRTAVAS